MARSRTKPGTTDDFRRWGRRLVLDNWSKWRIPAYFLEVVDELLKGTREVWLDVPEGNAKTTCVSAFILYHLSYVPDARVPVAASSRDQSMWLWQQAAGFVTRTPELSSEYRTLEGYRRVDCKETGGRMQVFAADDRTGDGAIFTLAVLEEAHRHPSLRLYRTWHGKMDKRGGQILSISTAGEPGGEYETTKAEFIARATDLERDGRHTVARGPGFVLHRHALDLADDIHDLKLVKQANPFEGITLKSLKSKHDSPARLDAHWARFTCGVAVRLAGSAISAAEWDQLERGVIPEGEPVWVGADFGWKWDTTAITPLWLPTPERWVFGKPAVIVPPRDGTSTSSRAIKAAFEAIHRRNPIHTVVMDENAGGAQMAEWIRDELDAQVVAYGQTDKPQALAFDRFTEGVREGSIEHPHDETFTLHVLNAIARGCLGDRYKFDKPRNRSTVHTGYDLQVIDALSAASAVLAAATGTETSESFDIEEMRMVTL